MISHVGREYSSTIQANNVAAGDCNDLFTKLQHQLEGYDQSAIDLAVNTLTSFSCSGLTIPKYVADITICAEHLTSIIPAAMTVKEFIDTLYVQSLFKGFPDSFDSFLTSIRLTVALTPVQVRIRVLVEDTAHALSATYSKAARIGIANVG
jgi:hypothetical protein